MREVARKSVQERSVSSIVPKVSPMAAMAQELAGLGQKTRIGIARGLARASEVVSEMQGVQVIDNAHEIKSVAQTAGLIHGWDKSGPNTAKIRLEVISAHQEKPVYDVESQVINGDTWE